MRRLSANPENLVILRDFNENQPGQPQPELRRRGLQPPYSQLVKFTSWLAAKSPALHGDPGDRASERAWRDDLVAHGYDARRGQQFSGSPDSPDVICAQLSGLHFEVKAVERLNVNEAIAQAVEDAGDKIPIVAHKRNRGEWLVTMRANDWFKMLAKARPASAAAVQKVEQTPSKCAI
jgi:hypothetical protein